MDTKIKPPADYVGFYRKLAIEDIQTDIVPVYYKNAQRDKLIKVCGKTDGKMVMEVGIGKDPLLCHLQRCSCRVAVDIVAEYLERLPEDVIAWRGNAEEMKFKDSFDLIICSDVLEHVLHPDALLQAIRIALKSSGRAVLKMPYKENLSQYIGTRWEGCHLRTFDEDSLERILIKNGLHPIDFRFNGFDCSVHYYPKINRFLNYALVKTRALDKAQKTICRVPDWIPPILGYKPIEITAVVKK